MPIMDGYEATKIIRSGQLGTNIEGIPPLLSVQMPCKKLAKKVLNLGMNDYMTKPVNMNIV
jgi:CheY-like chemotaxis protein